MSDIDWSKAPELATHCTPKTDNSGMYRSVFWRVVGEAAVEAWPVNDDWVTAEHFTYGPDGCPSFLIDRAIGRPQYHEWTGTGLPPVGTVCWVKRDSGQDSPYEGECEVIAHHMNGENPVAVYVRGPAKSMYVSMAMASCFSAIRTQEQIEAEEREKAIKAMLDLDPPHESGFGLTSRRTFCEILHDAGYRKQEPKQ